MTQFAPAPAPHFDAGPLSWVIGEIRDALQRSAGALRDAAGRAPQARPTLLLHAKSHLHQAHGALQMVDVGGVGLLGEAAERAIDRFKDGTLALGDAQVAVLADAYGALVEYLEDLLAGGAQQPLRLFPYYRALQELLGAERVHPGALLALDGVPARLPDAPAGPAPDLAACRGRFEKALLPFLRGDDAARRAQAAEMRAALAPISQGQSDALGHAAWLALQTVADLAAQGRLDADIYLKQLFGQVNLQLRRLVQGHAGVPEALLRDALFFVAAAAEPTPDARLLRAAWGLDGQVPPDYLERRYGRVDPAALQEAKEALLDTKQGWDRIAGADADHAEGDFDGALARLAGASERLGAPALAQLLRELGDAAGRAAAAGASDPRFGLEMAEAMLFVEHSLEQVRQLPDDFGQHAEVVGQRLLALAQGATPPDAPHWQGELAHGMREDHTVAVLAGELRGGLRQVEKLVEEYHAAPAAPAALAALRGADPLLHQLQGALAILDQDQALRAVDHVRAALRALAAGGPDAAVLDNVAQNIGALGFFVDALARSVDGARARFRFDAVPGLLREQPFEAAPVAAPIAAHLPALDDEMAPPAPLPEPVSAPAPPEGDAVEAELLEIFIGEAREVLDTVGALLPDAHACRADQDTLTRLRRAFHTLKGSGRMVGLERFAVGAAAVEKTMNAWLAEARAATPDLLALLGHAHGELSAWVEELAAGAAPARDGAALAEAAERVRAGGAFALEEAQAQPEGVAQPEAEAQSQAEAQPQAEAKPDGPAHVEPQAEARAESVGEPESATVPAAQAEPETQAETEAQVQPEAEPQTEPESHAEPEAELHLDAPAPPDNVVPFAPAADEIKRIGDLAIPAPLYAIYVAETAELARVLVEECAAWRAAPDGGASASMRKAAHTLGGTSATVGFHALRAIAGALEAVLEAAVAPLAASEFDLLDEALERVRTMLQVFALGEPAPPQPELLARLEALAEDLRRRHPAVPAAAEEAEEAAGAAGAQDTQNAADAAGAGHTDDAADADDADDAGADLARRLDALFAAAYDSILAEPPLAGAAPLPASTALAPRPPQERPLDPAVAEVDDLFDAYFDAPAAAPPPAPAAAPAPAPAGDGFDIDALFDMAEPALDAQAAPDSDPAPAAVPPPVPDPDPDPEPEPEPEPALDRAPSAEAQVEPDVEPEAEPEPEPDPALATEPVFSDELDPDLLPVFMEEAADLLPQVGNDLRRWQQEPGDGAVAQGLLRALHTVKGSARMAGAMRLGQHVHALETQVENMLHAGTTNPVAFDELLASFDQAQLLFEQLQQPAAAPAPAAESGAAPVVAPAVAAPPVALVRVRADILDRLVNQAGEVSIARSKLETQVGTLKGALSDFSDNLARLRRQLREIEMQAETQIASRLSIAGEREFDPLEFDRFTRLQELTRMMAESVDDVASFQDGMTRAVDSANTELAAQSRLTRELQRDLMRVRMVPFASLSERLFRVARQTAKETDKRVNLDIRGGAVEIDRSVLERMAAPFEHLLRNAIVHGVEDRAARAAAGKAETGELLVQVSQQGNEVEIRFADDGAGFDLDRIRDRARAAGLLAGDADIADQDAAELAFEPGLSTADTLTELAGRGVGMDVVRSEARALGGRVDVASTRGKGAAFTIHLPLTLAVTQVVLVASGARTHALPAVLVEQVLQVREADLAAARGAGALQVQGEALALHYLPELLREPGGAGGQRSSPVMVLKNGAARIALQVDEVLGNREVVVKNIGPQLARLPGIAGATVLGSGEIVLILDPVQLPGAGVRKPGAVPAAAALPAVPRSAAIMVVDDSLTVRKVTQRLLEREGYRVLLAKDGVDALEQMQETRPDLMLVDIEMPRMDGFDLVRHVRGDAATRTLPIVMITSRTADKHRNYALGLGVDAYFGKPFQEQALLAAVAGLLGRELPLN